MVKELACFNKTTAKRAVSKSFANRMQAALRADGTDAMTSSSITRIFLELAVYPTTTSVWGALYTVYSRSRQPNT